jgi:preprotein translocase subunit SecD
MHCFTGRFALFAVSLVSAAPLVAGENVDKPENKIEFCRAESSPADGLTEASVAGRDQKVYLHDTADATDKDIAEIRVTADSRGEPAIEITFTKKGAKKMAKLSERHNGKPVAVVVEGEVISAPVVRARFSTKALITGRFTIEEAERIVESIRAD